MNPSRVRRAGSGPSGPSGGPQTDISWWVYRRSMRRGGFSQLRARHDDLADQIAAMPAAPSAAILRQVADRIADILAAGSHSQRKALIEALIAQIKITGPGRIVPVFRIPQPPAAEKPQVQTDPAITRYMTARDPVRAMTNLVGPVGLEPTLPST
jgi:site-specific DNA recombinase